MIQQTNAKRYCAIIKCKATLGALTVDSTDEIRKVAGNYMKRINVSPFP